MYHESFRKAVLTLYHYFGSMRRTAAVLEVSVASISRWSKSGVISQPCKRPTMITSAIKESVRVFLERETRLSSIDVVNHIRTTFGFTISRQLAHVIIRRLGFTFKRTRKRGISKRKNEATPTFLSSFMETMNRGNIVAIDESGFDQRPSPAYGYAPAGIPAIVKWKPSSDRRRLNLLMAIHASGSHQSMIRDSSINGSTFAEFIGNLPYDRGTTLLLDNASIHNTVLVKQTIADKGYVALFVPPYSPEFNPIELVFGVIKNSFYRLRYSDSFADLLGATRHCVEEKALPETIRICFKHVTGLVSTALATPSIPT